MFDWGTSLPQGSEPSACLLNPNPPQTLTLLPSGIPCVFWEHMFDWGAEMRNSIEALIDARRRNGICADSKLEILCAEADMYVARIGGR